MQASDSVVLASSNNGLTNVPGVDTGVGNMVESTALRSFTTLTAADGIYYNKSLNVMVVTKEGVTLSGIDFRGTSINIQANNVTISNCSFDASAGTCAINNSK